MPRGSPRPNSLGTQFHRTIDTARKDAHMAELRAQGLNYREIALAMDTAVSTVHRSVQRAIRDVPVEAVGDLRQIHGDQLDADYAKLNYLDEIAAEILTRNHYIVSEGHLVKGPDKTALVDSKPILDALNSLRANAEARRKNRESHRKLFGVDAPTRTEVTVLTPGIVETAIMQLEAEIAERANAESGSVTGPRALPAGVAGTTSGATPTT